MCLSIAVNYPDRVLSRGEHLGFEFVVTHNERGYRCGYVRIPAGHPWHGEDYDAIDADVHCGLSFGEPDVNCGGDDPDDAWWLGFDFCDGDPDPGLPITKPRYRFACPGLFPGHVWTQSEAEEECRKLCEQAAGAGRLPSPIACTDES